MAVDDLIGLVGAIDGILRQQAAADASYFIGTNPRRFAEGQDARLAAGLLDAYRWQYIGSGLQSPRFRQLLVAMTTPPQLQRIQAALAPLLS